jgi:hypothetical protein
MKRFVATAAVVVALLACEYAHAQVYGQGNGFGYQLNKYGRVRIYLPDSNGTTQLNRASILLALSKTNVGDYTEDANTVSGPTITAAGPSPRTATVLFDNSYNLQQPKARVRLSTYTWPTDPFLIARYTVINDTTISYPLYLGLAVSPEPGGAYGGETVTYDATKKVAYFFVSGTAMYMGLKIVSGSPYSFHVLDYGVYSPSDPGSDAADDSTRYKMTALPGFDNSLTVGVNGSIYNLNAGLVTIAHGDSSTFSVAYVGGPTLAAMLAAADSADARYKKVFTSIQQTSLAVPQSTSLLQNYPNPFNPGTVIEFQLHHAGEVSLSVYDVLGREVAVLASGTLNAGTYRVPFDGRQYASGIYYYRLVAGSFIESKRMLLVK